MTRKKTVDEWVEQANILHGSKYTYLTNEWGVNFNKVKVAIKCPVHGVFHQLINDHVNKKCGCIKCSMKVVGLNNRKDSDYYLAKFIEKHGDKYTYDTSQWGVIKNNKTKVEVCCRNHGVFKISVNNHLNGAGCQACGLENRTKKRTYSKNDWLRVFNEAHGDEYDYDNVNWGSVRNMNSKVQVRCAEHGLFETSLNQHQRGHGCPSCSNRIFRNAYVNIVDDNALKFGVTSNPDLRLKRLKMLNKVSIENLKIWHFEDPKKPIEAESFIKKSIATGVVSKHDMPDGYSETCSINNLGFIISTFESFGGVIVND